MKTSGKGDAQNARVMVMMGSDSDLPVMMGAVEALRQFDLAVEVEVTSAHRSPDRTREIVRKAEENGVEIFIVGAGAAAHLAGTVAALTTKPVLGVPISATTLGGLDALLSTVQMPAGIPVATLAIGEAGSRNAGLLAAAVLALSDDGLAGLLVEYRKKMAAGVEEKSRRARQALEKAGSS
jgi:phosphoribosylaminoimidazole carboxylase PurE protein